MKRSLVAGMLTLTTLGIAATEISAQTPVPSPVPTTMPTPSGLPLSTPITLKTPGWGPWRPHSQLQQANIDSGFSNMELGGFLDFQNSCSEALGQPMDAYPNWFRISNLVDQIGTGEVEYGCWANGKFYTTITHTAIKRTVKQPYCLQARSNTARLEVYREPKRGAKRVTTLKANRKIYPAYQPANVMLVAGENWVEIESPVKGWVLHGRPTTPGNLQLCR